MDMWDYNFKEPHDRDLTAEENKLRNDEANKIKQEWLKKAKKKKWGDEEEKAMIEEYKKKVTEKFLLNLADKVSVIDQDGEWMKAQELIKADSLDLYRRKIVDD